MVRELTDLRHNAKQPIQHDEDMKQPGWATCDSCGFVGLKTEFKAAQTGADSFEARCPKCDSSEVVIL